MKRATRLLWLAAKVLIGAIISIEVLSFLAITITNFILYGHPREGPRSVYDPYTLFLQSAGPRTTMHNSVSLDPVKNRTLWLFGGSTMRGENFDNDKTIPSYLAEYLNSGTSGLHFTVKNYGMNAFNSLLETKYLQKLLAEGEKPPHMIVFYDAANDAKYFAEHRNAHGHYGFRRTSALIESYYRSWFGLLKPLNAAIYASFAKELYDKIHQLAVPLEPDSPELRRLVDLATKRYDYVDKVAECMGADFILFWQPTLWVEECPEIPADVKEKEKSALLDSDKYAAMRVNFALPYLMLADRLKHKPYFVSLQDALCTRKVPAYMADGVHTTEQGNKILAMRMGRIIEKRMEK
ncbi:MAG: SGNH/GDSL hydrolase family protein [Deltaproteobacteria bacterium]|nr:SGNH/GDSL hydrolase family protein [Deltaproteobacteria bacterium]